MNVHRAGSFVSWESRCFEIIHIDHASVTLENPESRERKTIDRDSFRGAVGLDAKSLQSADLKPVAALARLSESSRERCAAIGSAIDSVHADQSCPRGERANRVAELLAMAGIVVSERQAYRYLRAYSLSGIVGLIDRRHIRPYETHTDLQLVELVEKHLADQRDVSTGTVSRLIARVGWEAAQIGVVLPSTRTMYRIVQRLDRKRGSFGSAVTRRSKLARPDRTFRHVAPSRPGEMVEIDSTTLDLFVQLPDGSVGRPELTYAIDVATGTIGGTLLHSKAAKGVDIGAVLLTRMLTRIERQDWWREALDLAEWLFGGSTAVTRAKLEGDATNMPLIIPESITVDRGRVFVGATFTAACERLEISQVKANPRQGTDKPHVEGGFRKIREGFVQYLAGYAGGNVRDRGAAPHEEAVWTFSEVQLLLDIWVVSYWQTTPQSGLRLPGLPKRMLSPNQMYASLSAAAPQVEVQLTREDHIALLPLAWRTVQPYGVNFAGLVYDADGLHSMRGRRSGIGGAAADRWEVRHDPYDLRRIWVRDHHTDRWIAASWTLGNMVEHPFSYEVLRAARSAIAADSSFALTSDLLEEIQRVQSLRTHTRSSSTPAPISKIVDPLPALRAVEAEQQAELESGEYDAQVVARYSRLRLLHGDESSGRTE